MKNAHLFLLFLALSISMAGCKKADSNQDTDDEFRLEANLLMSKKLFNTRLGDRDLERTFEIKEITRKGNLLEVDVVGGGVASAYQFIWNGLVQESFPMGIRLILLYDDQAEFDQNKEMKISVNLEKIIGKKDNMHDYHFYVINGSRLQTVTLDPNGTVTAENK